MTDPVTNNRKKGTKTMSIKFNGLMDEVATFKRAAEITKGYPVKVSANDTVAAAANGNPFCGVAVNGSGSLQGVQLKGYVELPYSGTAPTVGYCALVANGNGGVKADASGRSYLVVNVDTTDTKVGLIL